jgi:hypothetical protein
MSESARSVILRPSVPYGVAAIALVLTIVRQPVEPAAASNAAR